VVAEVARAAHIRSLVERHPVSPDLIVERALRDYLWLDDDEMRAGGLKLPLTVEPVPPPVYHSSFGAMVRAARVQLHLNRGHIAKVLGVSARAVADIERGIALPSKDDISKLATLLQVDVQQLLAAANMKEQ
jgi:DNA-binding XRE family transcriptional regulator